MTDKEIEKRIAVGLDSHIKKYEKLINTVKKAKKAFSGKNYEIYKLTKMFRDHGIEIYGIDISKFYNGPEDDNEGNIFPYSTVTFRVKRPDNDVMLDIPAEYVRRSGRYRLKGEKKFRTYDIRGYALGFSIGRYGTRHVDPESARATTVKTCIAHFSTLGNYYAPTITANSDRDTVDCFFDLVNALLSIRNKRDADDFKTKTAPVIAVNLETLRTLNNIEGKHDTVEGRLDGIETAERQEWFYHR